MKDMPGARGPVGNAHGRAGLTSLTQSNGGGIHRDVAA